MHAIILSIGDELVLGQTVDTNSAWLSQRLARLGIATLYHQTVADDRPAIADMIRLAAERGSHVIISGGLGPTEDDLTRFALADAMGVALITDEPSVVAIRSFFEKRGRKMPERNTVQARHPVGSTIIANTCGTAPGIRATLSGATIYVVPGVPREMRTMYELSIEPELLEHAGGRPTILTTKINTFGVGESDAADLLGDPLQQRDRNPKVGTTVSAGIVAVRIRSEFANAGEAQRELDATATEVESKLGALVFGRDGESLAGSVFALLNDRGKTLATAESCTGGLLGAMITDVPGSSAVYLGGWVTYAYGMKTSEVGVPESMLEVHGAVSEPVAKQMALGALERSGADYALSLTGVAGPTGGSAEKPVGTVWIALAHRDGETGQGGEPLTEALLVTLPGDRAAIRDRAAKCALQRLRLHLLDEPVELLRWARRT